MLRSAVLVAAGVLGAAQAPQSLSTLDQRLRLAESKIASLEQQVQQLSLQVGRLSNTTGTRPVTTLPIIPSHDADAWWFRVTSIYPEPTEHLEAEIASLTKQADEARAAATAKDDGAAATKDSKTRAQHQKAARELRTRADELEARAADLRKGVRNPPMIIEGTDSLGRAVVCRCEKQAAIDAKRVAVGNIIRVTGVKERESLESLRIQAGTVEIH